MKDATTEDVTIEFLHPTNTHILDFEQLSEKQNYFTLSRLEFIYHLIIHEFVYHVR